MNEFNDVERAHFRALQHREDEGTLSPQEAGELRLLCERLEQQELELLAPALARMDKEAERAKAQSRMLAELVERKEALVARLEALLAEVQSERQAIDEEVSRVMSNGPLLSQSTANGSTATKVST